MGTLRTLEVMAQLARRGASSPEIRAYMMLGYMGLAGIDEWVRQNFRYRGELEEVVRTPEFMIGELSHKGYFEGDCDDIATLYSSLLLSWGFPCRLVAIRYDASPEFKHVFVEAFDGGEWTALDPTVPVGTPYTTIERMVLDV